MIATSAIGRMDRDYHIGFSSMATPCEVRLETDDERLSHLVAEAAEAEARRIEEKFSRYRSTSVLSRINRDGHSGLVVDEETANLLDCAAAFHLLSDGLFDVTSGVLRRVWKFDGSAAVPDQEKIAAILPLIGWHKVKWDKPKLTLPAGMELDFGGVAKEYAVDCVLSVVANLADVPALVNFGGDLAVTGSRHDGSPWKVAIESVDEPGKMAGMLKLAAGALATSGDARRYLFKNGVRYCHILDPRTGWPVREPPRSVTVAAATCIEAGLTATLAMLKGSEAEEFLKREKIRSWCIR